MFILFCLSSDLVPFMVVAAAAFFGTLFDGMRFTIISSRYHSRARDPFKSPSRSYRRPPRCSSYKGVFFINASPEKELEKEPSPAN